MVMLLPAGEVADMTLQPYRFNPSLIRFQHCIIDANREQNKPIVPTFTVESRVDLVFNPGTLHGMFREDEQQLIMQLNRFVDALAEGVADLEVFGSEPAAYAFGLEVCVNAVGC